MASRFAVIVTCLIISLCPAPAPGSVPGGDPETMDLRALKGSPSVQPPPSSSSAWRNAAWTGPVPGDELWWHGFGLPAVDGYVTCIAEYEGTIVIGGSFSRIGEVAANCIAAWSTGRWRSIGTGVDGEVLALAVFNGELLVGGRFQHAGGTPARGIAAWNGSFFSPLGAGLHGPANSLLVHDGALVAGGAFTHSGSDSVGPIARWNGTAWTRMGHNVQGRVAALGAVNGTLYAGGHFTLASMTQPTNVARWNGSEWEDVGGGVMLGSNPWQGEVSAIEEFQGALIVGGTFDTAGGAPAYNIARWSGTAWEGIGPEFGASVRALEASDSILYAGRWWIGLGKWDGSSWSEVPGIQGTVYDLHASGHDLYAGGTIACFAEDSATPVGFTVARRREEKWYGLERWEGTMRGLLHYLGGPGSVYSMVSFSNDILVTGFSRYAGSASGWTRLDPIAAWDGEEWRSFEPKPPGYPAILLPHGEVLYAGGYFATSLDTLWPPVLEYDGHEWVPLGHAKFTPWTLEVYQGALYASGSADESSDPPSAGVYRWTGSQWQTIGIARGAFGSYVYDMVEHDGKLVVAGSFETIDGVRAANVALWDGSVWHPLGPGLEGHGYSEVRSVAVHEGTLVAAGPFLRIQFQDGSIARWTGSTWELMGTVSGGGGVLTTAGGDLFAGGSLYGYTVPNAPDGVLRWNGGDWEPLGSGTHGPVWAFAVQGTSLYMGGSISAAGGRASFGIARWDGLSAPPAPRPFLAAAPNPFRSSTVVQYQAPMPGSARIVVFDLHGRTVKVLHDGPIPAGPESVTWDGMDQSGRRVAAGVYFVGGNLPGNRQVSRKVVVLR